MNVLGRSVARSAICCRCILRVPGAQPSQRCLSLPSFAQSSNSTADVASEVAQSELTSVAASTPLADVSTAAAEQFGLQAWGILGQPAGLVQELALYLVESQGWAWPTAVLAIAAASRLLVVPVTVRIAKFSARIHNSLPERTELEKKYEGCAGNLHATLAFNQEMLDFQQKKGISPFSMFTNVFIQAPVFFSGFFGLRDMAARGAPGLDGGLLWMTDLGASDPTCILPIANTGMLLAMMKFGVDTGSTMPPGAFKIVGGMLCVSCVFMTKFPAVLLLYWISSNLIGFCIARVLTLPAVKLAFGIPKKIPHGISPTDPFEAIRKTRSQLSQSHASQELKRKQLEERMFKLKNNKL